MEPRDINDPALVRDRRWAGAINRWMQSGPDRSTAELETLLRDPDGAIPDFAREFLADLVAGRVEPNIGGRPAERSEEHKRTIAFEVYADQARYKAMPKEARDGRPRALAIEQVAARRGISDGAVRGIVEEMTRAGLTFDIWDRYIRRTGNLE